MRVTRYKRLKKEHETPVPQVEKLQADLAVLKARDTKVQEGEMEIFAWDRLLADASRSVEACECEARPDIAARLVTLAKHPSSHRESWEELA